MKVISKEIIIEQNGWRTTKIAVEGARPHAKSVYAVCVKSDDSDFLTVSKLYRIDVSGEYATLTDNQGGISVYPLDFFLQLQLSQVTKTQIAAALSI